MREEWKDTCFPGKLTMEQFLYLLKKFQSVERIRESVVELCCDPMDIPPLAGSLGKEEVRQLMKDIAEKKLVEEVTYPQLQFALRRHNPDLLREHTFVEMLKKV